MCYWMIPSEIFTPSFRPYEALMFRTRTQGVWSLNTKTVYLVGYMKDVRYVLLETEAYWMNPSGMFTPPFKLHLTNTGCMIIYQNSTIWLVI